MNVQISVSVSLISFPFFYFALPRPGPGRSCPITMEPYALLVPGDLIRLVRDGLASIGWPTLAAILVSICVATRLITGFQSRLRGTPEAGHPRPVRTVPYWLPWLGHGPAFAWDHVSLIQKSRCVPRPSQQGLQELTDSAGSP